MLTREQVLEGFDKRDRGACGLFDPRDAVRLAQFFETSDWPKLGIELKEGAVRETEVIPWTRENLLEQARRDVAFGFEKALDKRGISANLMREVVSMWLWVFEIDSSGIDYAQYGLPLLRHAAVALGFDNPIGDDTGTEDKYASD